MVRVKNLTKNYGPVKALEDITLEVNRGELLAVIGPSGCGKTTLLRIIAGFEKPDKGNVIIDGVEVSTPKGMLPPFKRSISMIFQDLALWPHMTVREHIAFVMKNNKRQKNEENIKNILKKVNLSNYHNCFPHQLSGGEGQRLAIARALASSPAYMLMDEPFSNLDILLKDELQKMVVKLKKESQMGIIYVTHNIEEAFSMADKIAVMNKASIEIIGEKEEICNKPGNEFIKAILQLRKHQ